jgi:hypothetical protein
LVLASQTEKVTEDSPLPTALIIQPYTGYPVDDLTVEAASGKMSVELRDELGALYPADSDTLVNLNTTSGKGRFDTSDSGAFNGSVTSVIIAKDSSSADFYYKDSNVGTPVITASSIGLTGDTLDLKVKVSEEPRLTSIGLSIGDIHLTSGLVSGEITLTLKDQNGADFTVTSPTTINLSTSSGKGRFDTNPAGLFNGIVTSVTVAATQDSATFYYKDGNIGTPKIVAARVGLTSGILDLEVKAAPVAKTLVLSGPSSMTAGIPAGPFKVQIKDQNGDDFNVTSPITINLYTTSIKGTFAATDAGPFNGTYTRLVISSGNSATFYYKDNSVGNPKITVAANRLTGASQFETVSPTPAP